MSERLFRSGDRLRAAQLNNVGYLTKGWLQYCLTFPYEEPGPWALPDAADRAGKFLGFDGDGKPFMYEPTSGVTNMVTATGSVTPRSVQDRAADKYHVKDFGAVGGGVVDDAAAIQAAMDKVAETGGVLEFGPQAYLIGTGLTLSNARGVHLLGSGKSAYQTPQRGTTIIYNGPADGDWIAIDGDHCAVTDMELRKASSLTLTGGCALNFTDVSSGGTRCAAERLVIQNAWVPIKIAGLPASRVTDVIAYGFTGGAGFWWFGDTSLREDNGYLTRVTMQAASGNTTGACFLIEGNVASLFATDCYASQGQYGYHFKATGTGEYPGASRWLRCAAEAAKSHGYYLQKTRTITIIDSFVGGNGLAVNGSTGNGIYVVDVTGSVTLDTLDVRTNGEHGIRVWPTATYVNIVNPQVAANSQNSFGTHSGIWFENGCDGFSIIGGRVGGDIFYDPAGTLTQKYGIGVSNGCVNFIIANVNVLGNLTANIIDSSTATGSVIRGCVGFVGGENADTAAGVTPNGSGLVVITHGLLKTPIYANVTLLGDTPPYGCEVQSLSATQLVARIYDQATGADVTAGTFDVMWHVRSIRA